MTHRPEQDLCTSARLRAKIGIMGDDIGRRDDVRISSVGTSRYEVSCGGVFTIFPFCARGAVWWSFDAGGKCDLLSHPASDYKRTKTRCRDESYSLCPVVLFRATFRSREVSCCVPELHMVPLAISIFSRKNISTIASVEMHRLVIRDNGL